MAQVIVRRFQNVFHIMGKSSVAETMVFDGRSGQFCLTCMFLDEEDDHTFQPDHQYNFYDNSEANATRRVSIFFVQTCGDYGGLYKVEMRLSGKNGAYKDIPVNYGKTLPYIRVIGSYRFMANSDLKEWIEGGSLTVSCTVSVRALPKLPTFPTLKLRVSQDIECGDTPPTKPDTRRKSRPSGSEQTTTPKVVNTVQMPPLIDLKRWTPNKVTPEKVRVEPKPKRPSPEEMFDQSINANVMFMSQGKGIKVSRLVVSPKSKVIKQQLDSEFEDLSLSELNPAIVVVKDVEYEPLREVMRYLYTSKIDMVDVPRALKVYQAAVKYDIELLKDLAEIFICKNLSDDNVTGMVKVAKKYQSDTMKEACLEYICKKKTDIRELPGILELDTDLLVSVIEKMCAKKK